METPVLLLVYNRAEQTRSVLERLREYGRRNVHVSADGAKDRTDRARTDAVQTVLKEFNDIITASRFSEQHLGCKHGVLAGLNWFFEQVDHGIVLEDDCLPGNGFFRFMEDMLQRYCQEKDVMMVCGNNPLGEWTTEGGHFFSRIGTVWGWATWRDRWLGFHPDLPELDHFVATNGFQKAFGPTHLATERRDLSQRSVRGEIDTWDYQWNAHLLIRHGLAVIPEQNLVRNIGFGTLATHTHACPDWIRNEVSDMHPQITARDRFPDREFEMSWHLAKRSQLPASPSLLHFSRSGSTCQSRLRILHINTTDKGGGAETLARMLHEQLLERGHDSHLLVEVKKSRSDTVSEINGRKLNIDQFSPDVIHVHNLHGTSITLNDLTTLSQQTPVLFTLHDTWSISGSSTHPFLADPNGLSLLERKDWKQIFAMRKNALTEGNFRFTAPSHWLRELFFQHTGLIAHYVPNAIVPTVASETSIPSPRFLLFVANGGENNPYKDLGTLRIAWQKANEQLGTEGCDLIVVGGRKYIEKIGQHTLYSVGKIEPERVIALMRTAAGLVQASKQDNAPLTILEAHACNTAVIASLVGGIPEMLGPAEQAFLYEPGNADQLADRIVQYLGAAQTLELPKHATVQSVTDTYLGHYLLLSNG